LMCLRARRFLNLYAIFLSCISCVSMLIISTWKLSVYELADLLQILISVFVSVYCIFKIESELWGLLLDS
jgi:hypothetical protein